MRKRNGSKLLIVLLLLCLAGFGLLGAEAWRIISERQGGAEWHEQELAYISVATPVPTAEATEAPMDDSATPEPEAFEDLEPIVFAGMEDFVIPTNPPFPVSTAESKPTAELTAAPAVPGATAADNERTSGPTVRETPEPVASERPASPDASPALSGVEPAAAPVASVEEQTPPKPTAAVIPSLTDAPVASDGGQTDRPVVSPSVEQVEEPTAAQETMALATIQPPEEPAAPSAVPPSDEPTAASTQTPALTPEPEERMVGRSITSSTHYTVDFAQLSKINEDVRAWLMAEDTIINYPVVQAEDNEYYLSHLFSGAENKTGAVFMDCGNSRYFTSICTWLYGHNRQDDTMFAVIPQYADQAFFDAHPTMYLLTPYGDYLVQLFACIRANVTEAEEWHVKSLKGRKAFEAYVQKIRSQSRVTSDTEVLWGDQLLAMSTCTNQVHEERYILFGVLRPILYEDDTGIGVTQLELENRESYTKMVEIPGFGQAIYYAQNDPTWSSMIYEARRPTARRRFGTSGGGPTALAIAIANLADDDQLSRLLVCPSREEGFTLCACSVNQYFCNNKHVQMRVDGLEQLKRYLPVVLANFATGNNLWDIQSRTHASGTNADFFPYVANACSLDYRNSRDTKEMISALQEGAVVIAGTGGIWSPFTGGGHYVVIFSVDETYLYIVDPYLKEDYSATDPHHVLEVLEPGVLRVKWSKVNYLRLYDFYIIQQGAWYVPPESRTE